MRPVKQVLLGAFLTLAPVFVVLDWWRALSMASDIAVLVLLVLLYIRAALSFITGRLAATYSKASKETPDGKVSPDTLGKIQKYCKDPHSSIDYEQMRFFTLSVISPATLRRRVIDEFTPQQRTVQRSVSVEIDLHERFLLDEMEGFSKRSEDHGDPRQHNGEDERNPNPGDLYVALALPKKGVLYDQLKIVDDQGATVHSLSHTEYRILAAKVLRTLLISAYGAGAEPAALPLEAERAERAALEDVVAFSHRAPTTKPGDERLWDWPGDAAPPLTAGMRAILGLGTEGSAQNPENRDFLLHAARLTGILAERYAVVIALAANNGKSRFFVRYERTEIPSLDQNERSLKSILRQFLGARPVGLTVNAGLALTCQSYHLHVHGPDDLYLADFDLPSIQHNQSDDNVVALEPYWRVRGRRGQSYLHVYTRKLTEISSHLSVKAKFFEVPPGSIGRAAPAAVAAFLASVAVAAIPAAKVDSDLASFILALPGIAAAWLGFDSSSSALLSGTLAARMSLAVTFLISVVGSTTLLLQKSGILPSHPTDALVLGARIETVWLAIVSFAFVNLLVTCYYYWERSRYYRTLAVREVDGSAVIHGG